MTVSRDNLAQITHIEATKSKAITALAEFWGVDISEIVSFGDDLNDIDMLTVSGVSVAMGNAVEEVKKIATEICDTNNNDGVAKWIKERLL